MNERAALAIKYAKQGLKIVLLHGINSQGYCTCYKGPKCDAAGKHPRFNEWQKKPLVDEKDIIACFDKYPVSNFGFHTSGEFFVVDIDPKKDGFMSIKAYPELNDTVKVKTGSGGAHHYFKKPEGMKIKNIVDLLPGVDIRSDNGQVVAPGNPHISGGTYEWEPGHAYGEVEIADPNPWIIELIKNGAKATAGQQKKEIPKVIEEGSRNSMLTSMAGALRRKGLSSEAIHAALCVENDKRCNPPLDETEVMTIARSMNNYSPEDPVTEYDWNEETKKMLMAKIDAMKDYSKIFDRDMLSLLVQAKKNDMISYVAIKTKLRRKINLEDLEKSVNQHARDISNTSKYIGLSGSRLYEIDIVIDENAQPPVDKLMELMKVPKFRRTAERNRTDFKDPSVGAYDMSAVSFAAKAGWTNQEITDLLISIRRQNMEDISKDNIGHFKTMIAKARRQIEDERMEIESKDRQKAEEMELEECLLTKEDIIGKLNKILGINIKKITKYLSDPPLYSIEMKDGKSIKLGDVSGLIAQGAFIKNIAAVSGIYVGARKVVNWDIIAQLLLDACEMVYIGADATDTGSMEDMLSEYLEVQRVYSDIKDAVDKLKPFYDKYNGEEYIFISGKGFRRWVETTGSEKLTSHAMGITFRKLELTYITHRVLDKTYKLWGIPKTSPLYIEAVNEEAEECTFVKEEDESEGVLPF